MFLSEICGGGVQGKMSEDQLRKIHGSCIMSTSVLPAALEKRKESPHFLVWIQFCLCVPSFTSDYYPPQAECQRICRLIGLYMNVNCICSNNVCSFTDFFCFQL